MLKVLGTQEITLQGTEINLTPPWNRITMAEGVKKYTGEDFDALTTVEDACYCRSFRCRITRIMMVLVKS